ASAVATEAAACPVCSARILSRSPSRFDAGPNCLNIQDVFAIKLEAAPPLPICWINNLQDKLEGTLGLTLPSYASLVRATRVRARHSSDAAAGGLVLRPAINGT